MSSLIPNSTSYDQSEVAKVALGLGIPFGSLWFIIAPGLLLWITKVQWGFPGFPLFPPPLTGLSLNWESPSRPLAHLTLLELGFSSDFLMSLGWGIGVCVC